MNCIRAEEFPKTRYSGKNVVFIQNQFLLVVMRGNLSISAQGCSSEATSRKSEVDDRQNNRKQSFLQFIEKIVQSYLSSDNNFVFDFYTNEYRSVIHIHDVIQVISYFIQNNVQRTRTTLRVVSHEETQLKTVYNMGGKDRVSRWDILVAVANYVGVRDEEVKKFARATQRVNPTWSDDVPGRIVVPSPLDISMNIHPLQTMTGIQFMGLEDIVNRTFDEMTDICNGTK